VVQPCLFRLPALCAAGRFTGQHHLQRLLHQPAGLPGVGVGAGPYRRIRPIPYRTGCHILLEPGQTVNQLREAGGPIPEARFREDLKADSLDLVELIMAFEETFGGTISDEDAQKITTVGEAVVYLEKASA